MLDTEYCFEIPAVRGLQAGRLFYSMTVPMGSFKRLIAFDTGNVLQRSQRDVNAVRAKKISTYIIENKQSYVLPSVCGAMDSEMVEFIESELSPNVGILRVNMDADLYLFDGQHRSTGAIDAVSNDVDLRSHHLPIMLFVGMTLEERQQAFADINGFTVKPSKSLSDTYNNRDDLPQLIVELAKTLPAFIGKVDFERNVVAKNSDYLFPVKILKDATMRLTGLKANAEMSEETKTFVGEFWKAVAKPLLWTALINWEESAEDFRNQYISSHGVFLNALGIVGAALNNQYGHFSDVSKLASLDIKRDSDAFKGRCIDAVTGNMLTDATAIKLTAIKMLCHIGCPIAPDLQFLEKKYFPDTVFPSAQNETENSQKPEEKEEPVGSISEDVCNHPYADMVRSKWGDQSEAQIENLCDQYESIAIEFGESVESAKPNIQCVISQTTKPTTVKSSIRAKYKQVADI
ncbi:DNA sulfur modification protein DndB [Vibrio vulnificus]|nr:DNA sulfur modification protein DndB [Vibrio vulnificus]